MNNRQKAKRFKLPYEEVSRKTTRNIPLIMTDRLPSVHLKAEMDFGRENLNVEFAKSALLRKIMPEVMKCAQISSRQDYNGNIIMVADLYVADASRKGGAE